MKREHTRLKKWEIALLMGLAVGLLTAAWAEHTQNQLAEEVLRLHVIANSDSDADQAQKLRVRDAVLAAAEPLLEGCDARQQAEQRLSDGLSVLTEAASAQLRREGSDCSVQVALEETWFPTKVYEGFALPCGRYQALRVVIGAGEGQNWWCVVFPPLCLGSAEDAAQQALATGVSQEDVDLMTQSHGEYTLKFKLVELWEEWKEKVMGESFDR